VVAVVVKQGFGDDAGANGVAHEAGAEVAV
jgi:hypothetical protein